jgi:glycosyltransferase involved in cell wall biosynthesis
MKYSICIPNYNYEKYLGETIHSVLHQTYQEFEILLSDNASTDRSVAIAQGFNDPRIQVRVNACNVGFAANLDRAARHATGERIIMLSSDDLMRPLALATYDSFFAALGAAAENAILSASWDMIDGESKLIRFAGPDRNLWTEADRQPVLEQVLKMPIYGIKATELLRRCLLSMKNPFNFAATTYSANLYRAVEGYGGGRLYNPDKWFHWRVLAVADMAYFIDQPLFAYRWHGNNQVSQQSTTSSLKFLVDEYVSTVELDGKMLSQAGVDRDAVIDAFVEHDIARHGLATLARGDRQRARRIIDFGKAAYPQAVRRNRKAWALWTLLSLGPLGQMIARRAYARNKC